MCLLSSRSFTRCASVTVLTFLFPLSSHAWVGAMDQLENDPDMMSLRSFDKSDAKCKEAWQVSAVHGNNACWLLAPMTLSGGKCSVSVSCPEEPGSINMKNATNAAGSWTPDDVKRLKYADKKLAPGN